MKTDMGHLAYKSEDYASCCVEHIVSIPNIPNDLNSSMLT